MRLARPYTTEYEQAVALVGEKHFSLRVCSALLERVGVALDFKVSERAVQKPRSEIALLLQSLRFPCKLLDDSALAMCYVALSVSAHITLIPFKHHLRFANPHKTLVRLAGVWFCLLQFLGCLRHLSLESVGVLYRLF